MRRWIMALTVIACLGAVPAFAGGGLAGDIEVGPYGGYGWLDQYGVFHPKDNFLYGGRLGFYVTRRWSVEGSAQRLSTKTDLSPELPIPNVDADLTAFRLNVLHNFRPGAVFRPFLTVGFGCEEFDAHAYGMSKDLGWNAGGGLRWFLSPNLAFRLDGRYVRTRVQAGLDQIQQNIEANAGLGLVFGGGSRVLPDLDSDGDGVIDRIDRCPNTPRGARVDSEGCPYDTDGDGVIDGPDQCPNTPAGCVVDARGCPLDADHDGVCDGIDRCPDTPTDKKVDAQGCPLPEPKAPPIFVEKKVVVLDGVEFDDDKSTLRPMSMNTLDRVAESLKDWPAVRVEVQGHTSEPASWAYNLALSQRRAEAVRSYLISKGVAGHRLVAKGYGKSRMIAENRTPEGQQKNRRVELHEIE